MLLSCSSFLPLVSSILLVEAIEVVLDETFTGLGSHFFFLTDLGTFICLEVSFLVKVVGLLIEVLGNISAKRLSTLLDDCLIHYRTLRVLILTGHGQISFCSGADLSEKVNENLDHI